MERALQEVLVPELRRRGFRGSLPHLRRVASNRVDYLSVQFASAGGSFVVEIARGGSDGKPEGYGRQLPIQKLNVAYFTRRLRLGSHPEQGQADYWFDFGPKSYDPPAQPAKIEHYRGVASSVVSLLDPQAEPYWESDAKSA